VLVAVQESADRFPNDGGTGAFLFFPGHVELVEHVIRDFDDDSHIGMIVCFQ